MQVFWEILSPLSPRQMTAVVSACRHAIEEYLVAHPGCDDTWGELRAKSKVPSREDVMAGCREHGVQLPAEILERLATCRSAMVITNPGDLDHDPLQVAILDHILSQVGHGLVLFNGARLLDSDSLQLELYDKATCTDFGSSCSSSKSKSKSTKLHAVNAAEPARTRGAALLEAIERASQDPDAVIDLKRRLAAAPTLVQLYARLLWEHGAVDETNAARALAVTSAELQEAASTLEDLVRHLES